MGQSEETARNDDASREAALSVAILRISASLDLDTVLEVVVESARAMQHGPMG